MDSHIFPIELHNSSVLEIRLPVASYTAPARKGLFLALSRSLTTASTRHITEIHLVSLQQYADDTQLFNFLSAATFQTNLTYCRLVLTCFFALLVQL
jgi:hypothetical protein